MGKEKSFILKSLENIKIKRFLQREVGRAGISSIEIMKTPIVTRIVMHVRRPGIIVGRKGSSIKMLMNKLKEQFGIENPQIDVQEVMEPSLDAKLVAEKIANQIETGSNPKKAANFAIMETMDAGAQGIEIRVGGVFGAGRKARSFILRKKSLKKSGHPTNLVSKAKIVAKPKSGVIGIQVEIIPPGISFPDKIDVEAGKIFFEESAEITAEKNIHGEKAQEKAGPHKARVEAKPKPQKEKPAKKPAPREKAVGEKPRAQMEKPPKASGEQKEPKKKPAEKQKPAEQEKPETQPKPQAQENPAKEEGRETTNGE